MKTVYIALLASSFVLGCKTEPKIVKTQDFNFTKEGTLQLFKSKYKTAIANLDIEFAETDYETQTGLMHRTSMKQNHGMLFIFKNEQPRRFYMKNTQIALDIIYLDKDQKVVSLSLIHI